MKKSFLSIISTLTVLIISTLITACNENNVPPISNDEIKKSDTSKSQLNNAGTPALYNDLRVLFIESKEFKRIVGDTSKKNKITFSFFITGPDSLTLHGWKNLKRDTRFKPNPDMILFNGIKSTYLRNKTYLSNSVLYDTTIDLIIEKLGKKSRKFIVFFPQDPDSNNGLLIYKIRLIDEDPKSSSFTILANSGEDVEELNPSPPRGSYENF